MAQNVLLHALSHAGLIVGLTRVPSSIGIRLGYMRRAMTRDGLGAPAG